MISVSCSVSKPTQQTKTRETKSKGVSLWESETRETKSKGVSLWESLEEARGAHPSYCNYVSYFTHCQDFHP